MKIGIWLEREEDHQQNYGWFVYIGQTNNKILKHNLNGSSHVMFLHDAAQLAITISKDLNVPFLGVYDLCMDIDNFQPVSDYKEAE